MNGNGHNRDAFLARCPVCGREHAAPARAEGAPAAAVAHLRGARLVQVLQVVTVEGRGLDASDPVREVVRYLAPNGALLAVADPFLDSQRAP